MSERKLSRCPFCGVDLGAGGEKGLPRHIRRECDGTDEFAKFLEVRIAARQQDEHVPTVAEWGRGFKANVDGGGPKR